MTQANKTIHKEKKCNLRFSKNGNHLQNTLISPTATPEISYSSTPSESTSNTNQQQVQYQELKKQNNCTVE